jgi:hypothetical protein
MDDFVRILDEKERAMRSSITPGVLAALRPAVMAETKPLLDPVLALSHNVGRMMKEVNNLTATMASWPGVAQQQNGGTPKPSGGVVIRSRNVSGSEIPEALFAINSAKQSTTKISPFELVYGWTPVTSVELAFPFPREEPERTEDFLRKVWKWRKTARNFIMKQQARSKRYVDKYRSPAPLYRKGDLVLVFKKRSVPGKTKKLLPRAIGPYQVVKRFSPVCYRLEDIPHNRRNRRHHVFNAHVSIMKPYVARKEVDWTPWDTEEPGEAVREDLYDDQWSDEEDEVVRLETVQETGEDEDEEDEEDDDDEEERYLLGSEVDEEEEEDVRGRKVELPPSSFGRRRWATSRLVTD